MSDFVLVPGFWLGGRAWDDVAERLRGSGNRPWPVTLTGLGDRAHLAGPSVALVTHVDDIVDTIEANDLNDVILVGHSGGGMPVSMVVDRIPDRIAKVVYLESGPLPDGMSQADTTGNRQELLAAGVDLPFPSWEELGGPDGMFIVGLESPELRSRIERLATPEPLRAATDPVHYSNESASAAIPHVLVTSAFPKPAVEAMLDAGDPMFAGFAGRRPTVVEVPTGHWPMFSEPDALAEALVDLTSAR